MLDFTAVTRKEVKRRNTSYCAQISNEKTLRKILVLVAFFIVKETYNGHHWRGARKRNTNCQGCECEKF